MVENPGAFGIYNRFLPVAIVAEANSQILKLLKENALLKKELEHYRTPLDIEGLSGGDDEVILHLKNRVFEDNEYQIKTTWNELFFYMSNDLLCSVTKKELHQSLESKQSL